MVHFIGLLTGIVAGLAVGLVLSMLCIVLGPSTAEWLCETFWDRRRVTPVSTDAAPSEIIVSDLHIDTWEYAPRPECRARSFVEFLEALRADRYIQGFLLNGDLMDIPLFAGTLTAQQNRLMLEVNAGALDPPQGVIAAQYDNVLRALLTVEKPERDAVIRRSIFQTGNHDIGVNGLRYVRAEMPDYLPSVQAAWSPQLLLRGGPMVDQRYDGRWIYLEHGHEYDPFLWLYMRYAILDLLRGGHLRRESQFIAAMQRKGRTGLGKTSRGTDNLATKRAKVAAGLLPMSELPIETPPEPPSTPAADWDFAGESHTFMERLFIRRYRWAARMAFARLPASKRRSVKTVTFGHTHMPDRYVFPGGRVYVNSGDWCGNTTHQCYSVVHADGFVSGPFQWEGVEKARQRGHLIGDGNTASIEFT
jgi:UDP-2,3-diacylglucosamine pyrophosphatase LpxH